jgi:hypothetical protein
MVPHEVCARLKALWPGCFLSAQRALSGECRQFFDEHDTVAVFHYRKAFENPDDRGPWAREVNRALLAADPIASEVDGHHWAHRAEG